MSQLPHLVIRLLGPPQIELDGKLVSVETRKAIALLAYLAVTGQAQSRSTVAALLWPDSDETRAKATLRRTLTALNNAIGKQWLIADRNTLTLPPQPDLTIDLHRFAALLAQCPQEVDEHSCGKCLPLLQEAVGLVHGDFLSGFTLTDSSEFDDWQAFYSESYRQSLANALRLMLRCYLLQEAYDQAIQTGRRWLALDALHEPAHRALMEAYARAGQRTNAVRQYEECVRVLDEELGVPPQQETTVIYEQILAGEFQQVVHTAVSQPVPTPQPAVRLPRQLTSFVGRQEELGEIQALLDAGNGRLITIIGPGGTGKTRLALEAAAQRKDQYRHGVFFVPLAPVSATDYLPATIADILEFSFYGGRGQANEQKNQLLDFLREKEMLLVLDNFEHLMEEAPLIDDILQNAPGVQILVTSQERLNLVGESLVEIHGLDCPSPTSKDIESCSAVALFLQRANQVSSEFTLTEEQKPHVAQICSLVSGLPLGIEMASSWVRMLSCQEIARQIEQDLDFLATTLRNVPARHRSLRAVFEHSWRLLSPRERTVFGKLSAFRGGFSLEAAEVVAGATLPLLLTLKDKSLLQRSAEGRYEVPEILRQYGLEKSEPAAQAEVQAQHTAYFVRFLRVREAALLKEGQAATLAEISTEIENVRLAWRQAIASGDESALDQSMEALYRFYQTRSWFKEGAEVFGQVSTAVSNNPLLVGRAMSRQGRLLVRMSLLEEGQRLLLNSLELLRPLSVPLEVAAVLSVLGVVAEMLGDYAESRQKQEESLAIFRKSGETWGEANALLRLGNVAYTLGEFSEARSYYQSSLALRKETGDRRGVALCLNNLGSVADTLGEYEEAWQLYRESMGIKRDIGDRRGVAYSLNNLGHLGWLVGEYEQAKVDLEECLAIFRDIGDRKGMGFGLTNQGNILYEEKRFAEARQLYQESLEICREIGYQIGVAYAYAHLGQISQETAVHAEAIALYQSALAAARTVQATPVVLEILAKVAGLMFEMGQVVEAGRLVQLVLAQPAVRHHAANDARAVRQKLEARAFDWSLLQPWEDVATAVTQILAFQPS